MARATAIYQQIREGNTGSSLSDFYTQGMGTGLNFQQTFNLKNYRYSNRFFSTSRFWKISEAVMVAVAASEVVR